MRNERGFCYVVNTAGYCDEALQSVASLRAHMPDVAVAIVTTRDLFRKDDRVTHWIELPAGRDGPIIKTHARLVPYDRLVLLDTDTFVAGDLSALFDVLEAFDLAAVLDVTRGYDYGHDIPGAFPELNTGVLAFRNNPAVGALFATWEQENDRLCERVGARVLNDQASFRAALWRSTQVRFTALTSEYNFLAAAPGTAAGKVRLVHFRHERLPALAADLNRDAGPRAFVPALGMLVAFRGRRHWIAQFMRIARRFLAVLVTPAKAYGKHAPLDWAQESEAEAARQGRPLLP